MNDVHPQTDPAVPAGLSSEEARRRLQAAGPNELPQAPRRGLGRILLGVLREPMFLLLALCAAIYLAVGGIGEGTADDRLRRPVDPARGAAGGAQRERARGAALAGGAERESRARRPRTAHSRT
ncbi:MAG: cation-transporting P-type ATPase [Dokdonella sp.]|nr:cation-transporting P-type ATPase [Dokdonella sp.]